MSNKKIKIIEISVILIQFISSIVTAIFCSYSISALNSIMLDDGYSYYLSDIKKKFKFIFNLNFSELSKYHNNGLTTFSKGICNDYQCKSQIFESDIWIGGFLNINHNITYDESYIDFNIIDLEEKCSESQLECFRNNFYRTCIGKDYNCPITGIINQNYDLDENLKNFYNIKTSNSEFIKNNKFIKIDAYKENNLMYTNLNDGIPIINLKANVNQPCYFEYLIKSNIYLEKMNITDNYLINFIHCSIFKNSSYLPLDIEGDFDLDYVKMNFKNNFNFSNNDRNDDNRYLKIDEIDLKEYLLKINFTNSTEYLEYNHSNINQKLNIYIKKLFNSNSFCTVQMFKIIKLTNIYNLGQIRILLLRYLNWNFIDIIFIGILNIYIRGIYLLKRIRKDKSEIIDFISPSEIIEDEERKFQRETSFVVKLLHYFIIIIKIISGFVAKYVYLDITCLPENTTFYENCLNDLSSIIIYKKINPIILEIYILTTYISNINIATLSYDIFVTLYIIGKSCFKEIYSKIKNKIK